MRLTGQYVQSRRRDVDLSACVSITHLRDGDDLGPLADAGVTLAFFSQHFGGRRRWFVCPTCRRRCAHLFRTARSVECRRCCGLVYRSQRVSDTARAFQKVSYRLLVLPKSLTVNLFAIPGWRTLAVVC